MALRALDNEGHRTVKITGKKDLTAERLRAREVIDRIYIPRLSKVMGDPVKFALYRAKASEPRFFNAPSAPEKHAAQLKEIAVIEDERQDTQAQIDNAASAAEIDEILKGLTSG